MAARRYLRSTDFYDEMEDLGLMVDEKYLYAYLTLNGHMAVSGIYEINRRVMMVDTGISRERIDAIVQRLVAIDLIRYDAGLLFVPRIHEEQNLQSRKGWQSMLRRQRRIHADHRSDLPGAENQAFTAFLTTLSEWFYEIDAADEQDAEMKGADGTLAGTSNSENDPLEAAARSRVNRSGGHVLSPDDAYERAVLEAKKGVENAAQMSTNGTDSDQKHLPILGDSVVRALEVNGFGGDSGVNGARDHPYDDVERPTELTENELLNSGFARDFLEK